MLAISKILCYYLIASKKCVCIIPFNFIKNEIDSNKGHGERSLAFKVDRYKIYVKTWSEVFAEFQVRYDYLLKKLSLDRQKLQQSYQSADEVIDAQKESTARMPEEITVG